MSVIIQKLEEKKSEATEEVQLKSISESIIYKIRSHFITLIDNEKKHIIELQEQLNKAFDHVKELEASENQHINDVKQYQEKMCQKLFFSTISQSLK